MGCAGALLQVLTNGSPSEESSPGKKGYWVVEAVSLAGTRAIGRVGSPWLAYFRRSARRRRKLDGFVIQPLAFVGIPKASFTSRQTTRGRK